MKYSVMIYIVYTFFLTNVSLHGSFTKKTAKTECIDTHCHYLNSLTLPIEILSKIKLSKKQIKNLIVLIMNTQSFKAPLINTCLYEIDQTQSLHYVMRLWNMLNRYCFVHNEQLKKEYCILLLLIYKEALTYYSKDKGQLLHTISTYYHSINEKDLNEMLAILNIIAQELKPLIETMYATKTTTWREWISKHWFSILIVSAIISIKVMIHHKQASHNPPLSV